MYRHQTGRAADSDRVAAIDLTRAFDWSRHNNNSPVRGGNSGANGRAFDAAGSSGFAFLQSELELIEPKLVEPLQAVTHERDLPIKFGGGFPEQLVAWASQYASTGGGFYGLQGTSNTDIPISTADIQKGVWPTFNWTSGFTVSYIDLERMKFAKKTGNSPPFTLQELYEKAVKTVWRKALDQIAYYGFLGNAGLVNNTNAPSVVAVNGAAASTTWAKKTPTEILNDVNFGINQTVQNSGYDVDNGAADTLLLPYNQFAALTTPMSIGGVGYDSIISYIKRNCVAAQYFGNSDRFKIFPLPNPFISGQGIGNTNAQNAVGNGLDRAIFYRNDEDCLVLKIPTVMEPAMTIPTERGPGYSTFFVGCVGSIMYKRTTTMMYLDGI
jgi:hypothetical protein